MNGIELAARFALIVNNKGYCGPAKAYDSFANYFESRKNEEEVKKLLEKFEGMIPYLKAISAKSGREIFDYKVVEAYWIGNELLDGFEKKDLEEIIKALVARGLPEQYAQARISHLPEGFVPNHAFNVFYVGVGKQTGSVPLTIMNMNSCTIRHGKVEKVSENELIVKMGRVEYDGKRYSFVKESDTKINYIKDMIPNIKINDVVAVHWNFATMKLDDAQVKNLEKYTQKVLDVMNKAQEQST